MMDYSKLVSVIVPFYNQEKELSRCIKSIIQQNYFNFELILVDDGSIDNSLNICKDFASKDKRIKVIHQDNSGVSIARNSGLKEASGEYITFIDSDDYVTPDYIYDLLLACTVNRCNVSICNYLEVLEDKTEKCFNICEDDLTNTKIMINNLLYGRKECGYCWGKMWKKSFLQYDFKPYKYCEDVLFFIENLSRDNYEVAVVKKPLYCYVKSNNSVTGKKKAKDLMDSLRVASCVNKLVDYRSLIDRRAACAMALNFAFFAYLSVKEDDIDKIPLQKQCLKWIKKLRYHVLLDYKSTLKSKVACFVSYFSIN